MLHVDSLHKLGVSISYDRVLSISTAVGNSACRRFEQEGVVCPSKLRKELFTTAAIDNIDHNPSSNTAQGKERFMELPSRFSQNMDTTNLCQERNITVKECGGQLSTKSVRPLPNWYTDVPPCIMRKAAENIPKPSISQKEQGFVEFKKAKREEYTWLKTVEEASSYFN